MLLARPVVWIMAAATLMAALDLGRRILATNDEARFAILAQDMLSRGAWLFPQLNDSVYQNKPLLLAWLIALSSWPVGHVTQLTAVLPSAIAAVGTVLVVYVLGRDMLGGAAARFAALILMTTQGWFLHARLPMPDMLMTFFITASIATLWPMLNRRPRPWWVGFYALAGLAFWSKGLAGLLPVVVALAWALTGRRPGRWRELRLVPGLGLLVLIVAPWWLRGLLFDRSAVGAVLMSDYLFWYLPQSLPTALVTSVIQHLIGILFPWVLVLPIVIFHAGRVWRSGERGRDAVSFLVLWSAVMLLAVGITENQRLRYYLPLVPPMSLLMGWWSARAFEPAAPLRIPWRTYGVLGLVLAAATAAAVLLRPTWATGAHVAFPTSTIEVAVMAAGLGLMVATLVYGVRRRRLAQVFALAWIGSAVWVAGWYHWELERRNAAYDYPRVRAEAARLLPEAPVVAAWGIYELPFSFYFRRPVVAIATPGDLQRMIAVEPAASVVLTEAALTHVTDQERFRVLPLERLNFERLVLVTAGPALERAAPRPLTRPPGP